MLSAGKILAVDDEAMNLDLMEAYLAQAGHKVVRAEDGLVALQKLEENRDTDAIVLDRLMPNLGGMGFLQRAKADARFKNIPVVMLTGAATAEEAAQSIGSGARYILMKPYEGAMLIEIVNIALQELPKQQKLAGASSPSRPRAEPYAGRRLPFPDSRRGRKSRLQRLCLLPGA